MRSCHGLCPSTPSAAPRWWPMAEPIGWCHRVLVWPISHGYAVVSTRPKHRNLLFDIDWFALFSFLFFHLIKFFCPLFYIHSLIITVNSNSSEYTKWKIVDGFAFSLSLMTMALSSPLPRTSLTTSEGNCLSSPRRISPNRWALSASFSSSSTLKYVYIHFQLNG